MKKIILYFLIVFSNSFILHADIWDEIRTTALAPNNGSNGRALPLAGAWETGWYKYNWGYNPAAGTFLEPNYIIELIEKQHHLLVNIKHRGPTEATTYYGDYMEDALNYLEQKNQPITVSGSQYELNLYGVEPYKSLPASTSPRVLDYATQQLIDYLTPLPPVLSKWYDVGTDWVNGSVGMDMLQSIYPNPPRVFFLSNNEAQKIIWSNAETDQRYIDLYGMGQTDNFKRQKFAEAWTECYAEMLDGMYSGLNINWQNNSLFTGYQNGGPWECFGRWSGWPNYSLHYNSEISWEQNVWDGGSIAYYQSSGAGGNSDFWVCSMQVAAQNRVFMLEDQLADNPNFWHEISTWKGGPEHFDWLVNTLGQTYDGARYKGMVQFGMWLLTPRMVRHFGVGWSVNLETEGFEYFDAVMDAVDRVHTDPVLKKFWQYGALVENTSRAHPYQSAIPSEFSGRSRWFQLNTNLDPATPWSLTTEIPVFSLARVIGTTPNREWLLYAHSPLQDRTGVVITLPDYGTVTTDVSREGTFVHIKENTNDLIAYYNLDDTTNDLSGNGNNGTLVNNPVYTAAKINDGIDLNRASIQYINCGRSSILSSAMNELSVSVWVKADTLQSTGIDWILGKGTLATPYCGYTLRCYHKQLQFAVYGSTGVAVYGPTLQENVWYHITGVFKGGQYVKLIVNGVEYAVTTNIPSTIAASTNYDLQIGNGSYCSYPWDGIIDEVKIFNRALAQEEITDEAYKLVHLDFENITSNTVTDLSRHGNTGTLVNNPILTRTRVVGDKAIQLQRSNSEYANCGRSVSLNGTDELTVDTWVKANTLQSTGIDWILGKGTLASPQSGYTLRCYHKQLQFAVYGSTGVAVYGPTLEENVWYHITSVFKGGQYVKLIVNGVEYSVTTNIPSTIAASTGYDLQIGNGSYCSYPWDGIIDEVKIYNKALY